MAKHPVLSILSFLLVFLVVTGLYAQPGAPVGAAPCPALNPPPPPPWMPPGLHEPAMHGMHHPIWRDLASVGLDEKQQRALAAIRNAAAKSAIRKAADLRIARLELGETLAGETVNMKTIEQKVRALAALQADIELSAIKAVEEAKALLTPAQTTRLGELQKAGDMPGCPNARPPVKPVKKDGPDTRAERG